MAIKANSKIVTPINAEGRKNLDIHAGDLVRVWQKIEEAKGKFRLQAFTSTVQKQVPLSQYAKLLTVSELNVFSHYIHQ